MVLHVFFHSQPQPPLPTTQWCTDMNVEKRCFYNEHGCLQSSACNNLGKPGCLVIGNRA